MHNARKRYVAPIALIIALALTPTLSGCSVEGIISGVTGGNVNLSGTKMPEGFPSEVPVVSGAIQFGGFVADGDSKVFNVTVKVTGANPTDGIKSALEGAGFTAAAEMGATTDQGGTLIYTNDSWGVLAVVAKQDNEWIVNYTVTSTQSSN